MRRRTRRFALRLAARPERRPPTAAAPPAAADAGVFIERLFKTVKKTLWLQSIQLSLFSLPVSAVCMLAFDYRAAVENSLLVGFTPRGKRGLRPAPPAPHARPSVPRLLRRA